MGDYLNNLFLAAKLAWVWLVVRVPHAILVTCFAVLVSSPGRCRTWTWTEAKSTVATSEGEPKEKKNLYDNCNIFSCILRKPTGARLDKRETKVEDLWNSKAQRQNKVHLNRFMATGTQAMSI